MKNAILCGIQPSEFWNMTPGEMALCRETYQEKYELEVKENFKSAMLSAWFTVKWLLERNVPPYETLNAVLDGLGTQEPKEHKEMTDEEIFEVIKAMNYAFGGDVVETNKGGETD